MSKKLVPPSRSVKLSAQNRVIAAHCCNRCGFSFSSNPAVPHGYEIGPWKRRGKNLSRPVCWCSCGGIELELDDGSIAAIYHHEGCPAGLCAAKNYEREQARELETLEQLALREQWTVGL